MDIHRLRSVPYPISAINALAFSSTSDTSPTKYGIPQTLRLAVGRANGSIEIWKHQAGRWFQETVLRGGEGRSIEALVWTEDPVEGTSHGSDSSSNGQDVPRGGGIRRGRRMVVRYTFVNGPRLQNTSVQTTPPPTKLGRQRLFSVGYSNTVTEWDLAMGQPCAKYTHSSEIWSMAAQPKAEGQYQEIALGCEGGHVCLLSTAEGPGHITFHRTVFAPPKGARVLSLTFQNHHTIVAGYADSAIRVFNTQNKQQIRSMTLAKGPRDGPRETLVWSVQCLSNGSIVSGDSTGTLCFWDGKTYSLSQRIKSHRADILTVAVGADGKSVFSGGMDQRTFIYRQQAAGSGNKRLQWASVTQKRMHRHDVKVMAVWSNSVDGEGVVVSGGLDAQPIIRYIDQFGERPYHALPNLPQRPAILSAPIARLLVSWWGCEVHIWKLVQSAVPESETDGLPELPTKLVAKINLQGEGSITDVDITTQGDLLVVGTNLETKAFALRSTATALEVHKLKLPPTFTKQGAKLIKISPNGKWFCLVTCNSTVLVHRVLSLDWTDPSYAFTAASRKEFVRLPRPVKELNFDAFGYYYRGINNIAFSSDSNILAVTDHLGYIDTWLLQGREDMSQVLLDPVKEMQPIKKYPSQLLEMKLAAHPVTIYGQRWIYNAKSSGLPKLPAHPLAVSFRPSLASSETSLLSTQQDPLSQSDELPQGGDRLVVVTAFHWVYELHILQGCLSTWSTENSMALSREFQGLVDGTRGILWDTTPAPGESHAGLLRQRMWLYGVNWLWMVDTSDTAKPQSFRPDVGRNQSNLDSDSDEANGNSEFGSASENGHKRKRRRTLDAGSLMAASEMTTATSADKINVVSLTPNPLRDDKQKASNQGRHDSNRAERADSDTFSEYSMTDSEDPWYEPGNDTDALPNEQDLQKQGELYPQPVEFHTYKYRPILGIVPITSSTGGQSAVGMSQDAENGKENGEGRLEVVVVERPLWEVDLPARFHAARERDRE